MRALLQQDQPRDVYFFPSWGLVGLPSIIGREEKCLYTKYVDVNNPERYYGCLVVISVSKRLPADTIAVYTRDISQAFADHAFSKDAEIGVFSDCDGQGDSGGQGAAAEEKRQLDREIQVTLRNRRHIIFAEPRYRLSPTLGVCRGHKISADKRHAVYGGMRCEKNVTLEIFLGVTILATCVISGSSILYRAQPSASATPRTLRAKASLVDAVKIRRFQWYL